MATVKRKKLEKGYTYHEYAQKFRPKLLPKEGKDINDGANKDPLIPLCRPVLDDTEPESAQGTINPRY